MKNNTPQEIWDLIKNSKNILMTLHAMPDGDSIGSCTAFKRIIEQNTKANIKLISHDPIDHAISKLPLSREVEFGKDITDINEKDFDLLLCLDISEVSRIGKLKPDYNIPKNLKTINIDHHHTSTYYGDLNYILPDYPSCGSVLLKIFEELKLKLDKKVATSLLLGICTDSAFFTSSNSNKSIKDASYLIELGVDYYNEISLPVYLEQSLSQKKFYAKLIEKVKINKEKRFSYSVLSDNDISDLKLNTSEIRLGIKEIKSIENTDFCFTLISLNKGMKGSFRAKTNIDVSKFAIALGGGGHKVAAAFFLPNISAEEAEKQVLDTINKVGIQKSL